MTLGPTPSKSDDLRSLLAIARDVALDAIEEGQPVAWVGGAVPSLHSAKLLVACPIAISPTYWAVRGRSHSGHWFFVPPIVTSGTPLRRSLDWQEGLRRCEDSRKLTKPYYWTLARVRRAITHAFGFLDLDGLPESVRSAFFPARTTYHPTTDKDRIRARRREKRRESMSPAEKERFDFRRR